MENIKIKDIIYFKKRNERCNKLLVYFYKVCEITSENIICEEMNTVFYNTYQVYPINVEVFPEDLTNPNMVAFNRVKLMGGELGRYRIDSENIPVHMCHLNNLYDQNGEDMGYEIYDP